MSDFWKNLSGQGAQSGRANTQWYLDWGDSAEGKALLEKERAGTLAENEKPMVAAYHHYAKKGQAEGIESAKTVSESTGVPDLTDRLARSRRLGQTLSLLSGRGRKQSFLGGDLGSATLGGGSILGGG